VNRFESRIGMLYTVQSVQTGYSPRCLSCCTLEAEAGIWLLPIWL